MRVIFYILFILVLTGCSNAPYQPPKKLSELEPVIDSPISAGHLELLMSKSEIKEKLLSQYFEWKGTPYLLGGTSKKGIDCSAFVAHTYSEQFNINLPRTTKYQMKQGSKVSHENLQVGDLVFFRTGRKVRHVGIYLGDSEFLHASTSKGVTISNLGDLYWLPHFWFGKRI